MKKLLINLVHPSLDKSIVNKRILDEISKLENVTINNLYSEYPNFQIDTNKEQKLLLENDVIIFQFPMYWFSAPALLKEWFDTVLEAGFAHGGTYKLKDKSFTVAVSCGAEEKEYCEEGKEKKTVKEFLFPFYGISNYTKMDYKEPFITYEAEKGLSKETLNKYAQEYIKYIKKLSV
ncbi:NAD(P)H-dependent oxidoreductase [Arcobacter sp.]|uniref:NAD(P)H-dependent oxidoreductase n=1 Tax=Arcobacter sp. TaxID=1872629 RepID=UPI003D12E6B7